MIYTIESRPEGEKDWRTGGSRFSDRDHAMKHAEAVRRILDHFCPTPIEVRVACKTGDLRLVGRQLDASDSNQHGHIES